MSCGGTYADFEYYNTEYGGKLISATDFPHLAALASRFIDRYSRGKAKTYTKDDAVKFACCALAEQYLNIENAKSATRTASSESAEVKSQTVGSYSVTYRSGAEIAADAATVVNSESVRLTEIAREYLAGTGLLYRGGGCGCTLPTL